MSPEPMLPRRQAEAEDASLDIVPPEFVRRGEPSAEPSAPARVLKGLAAGVAAGLVAGVAMEQAQTKVMPKVQEVVGQATGDDGGDDEEDGGQEDSEPATIKAAETLLRRDVADENKETMSRAVHYATSALFGAIYGVTAEFAPTVRKGHGTMYGTAVWALNDEALVPLMGWSKPPWTYPASTHAYALASHLVYGAALDTAYGPVRGRL